MIAGLFATLGAHRRRIWAGDPLFLEAFLTGLQALWGLGLLLPNALATTPSYRLLYQTGIPAPVWAGLVVSLAALAAIYQARGNLRTRARVAFWMMLFWGSLAGSFAWSNWQVPGWVLFAGLATGNLVIWLRLVAALMAVRYVR